MVYRHTDFPPSCPPNEATEVNAIYYRACKHNPPSAADFEDQHDSNRIQKSFPPKKICECMALSYFEDKETLKNNIEKFKGKIGTFIFEMHIEESFGVVKVRPDDGHALLWEYKNNDIFNKTVLKMKKEPGEFNKDSLEWE